MRRGGFDFPARQRWRKKATGSVARPAASSPPPPSTPVVGAEMRESRLDSGLRVLTEWIPGVRSVAAGVWVGQGSAHERRESLGCSHLLEHMVFKGTRRRSAREIAAAVERLGGVLDAYTSREHTSYLTRVLDEHLPEALDVLADLVLQPCLRHEDLELEREVVLEEIATVEDAPDDLVFELHGAEMWGEHPYGHPILGTSDTVAGMSSDEIRSLYESRYHGANFVVAAAGNVRHGEFVERVQDLFSETGGGPVPEPVGTPSPQKPGRTRVSRDTAQSHVVFGTVAPAHGDHRRYPLMLLSAAFGGGMSSRLFQKVREELALAYSVYSFQSFYSAGGVSGVYVGTRPATEDRAIDAIRDELAKLCSSGLDPQELEEAKSQVKGQVILALESTGARLHRLAAFALLNEPFSTLDEILAKIDAVTPEDVQEVAREFFDPDRQVLLSLGP